MKSKPSLTLRYSVALALALQGAAYAAEPNQAETQTVASAAESTSDATGSAQSLSTGSPVVEQVTVTGSRLVTTGGYEAPTPLTVLNAAELFGTTANASVKESLQTLPVIAGGYSSTQGAGLPSFNQAGISSIEMRNLGINRTLVLLDGQRSVGSLASGVVDTDNFPQQLIERVEIVTGGASAVYGSDAVAGVVNFILDRDFTGVKGEVSGGMTSYEDAENYKVSLAAGFPFAGGRGHVLLSGELVDNDGVSGVGDRAWGWSTKEYIINPSYTPTNGQPEYVTRNNAFLSAATHGGLITYGPLRGTAFGEGGVPYQFQFGEGVLRDLFMAGGDYLETRTADAYSLLPSQERKNAFARVSYDVTDNINVFAQWSRGLNHTLGIAFPHYLVASAVADSGGLQVRSGNPFIPASVQARMTDLGLASFRVGTMAYDLPFVTTETSRATDRYVLGVEGNFDLFASNWSWNAYAQFGRTDGTAKTHNARNNARFTLALDAVSAPDGSIVCRSTLTDPTNGCVPFNPLGLNVNDQAALDYILGTASSYSEISQDVYAMSITGAPFENWAGPVSIAFSAEHREEKATVDPDAIARQAGWHSGNHQPLDAGTRVSEAAVEVLFPLLNGKSFAEQWDLTGAFRYTDYELSGGVNTWKIGTTWAPANSLRFRATKSRDIRAPSISDLFQSQNFGLGTQVNPWSSTPNVFGRTQTGSPGLTPEIGDTWTLGVVVQPDFAPGLNVSVDYWDTKVTDAIALVSANNVVTLCYQGWTALCPWITFDPTAGAPFSSTSVISTVQQGNFNLAQQKARGVDFEASYNFPLSAFSSLPGSVSMRLVGSRYIENVTDNGITVANEAVGATLPEVRLNGTVTYTLNEFTAGITTRYFSSTVNSNLSIECQTNCPPSNPTYITYDNIDRDGGLYFDLSLSYRPQLFGNMDSRVFLNIRNITNEDPELVPHISGSSAIPYIYSRTGALWDTLGRVYRLGMDFKF